MDDPTAEQVGATWSRIAEAGRRAIPAEPTRCSIPECDELPEDHYHPLLTQDVLARAIADAFAEHIAIDDPRWPHMIAGFVIEKLPTGLIR